ncbi:MAG: hypothetical protein WDA00_05850 [Eubacteriales bacterium]
MKRKSIANVLYLSFLLNLIYCAGMAYITINQCALKLAARVPTEVANMFSIPTLHILLAGITLLFQLVLVLNFSVSMRNEHPTIWIETVGIILFSGILRGFNENLINSASAFALFRGRSAAESIYALNDLLAKIQPIYAFSTGLFLVGCGMAICFKKFIRQAF